MHAGLGAKAFVGSLGDHPCSYVFGTGAVMVCRWWP